MRMLLGNEGAKYGAMYNAVKYLYRRGSKADNSYKQDTEKAKRYLVEAEKFLNSDHEEQILIFLSNVADGEADFSLKNIHALYGVKRDDC